MPVRKKNKIIIGTNLFISFLIDYSANIKTYLLGLGGDIGYQFLFFKRIGYDIGLLLLMNIGDSNVEFDIRELNGFEPDSSSDYNRFDLRLDIGIGYAF